MIKSKYILRDESNETYHANPAVSTSSLKTFIKRPKLYKATYIDGTVPNKATAAMNNGNLVHKLVLEPNEFFDDFEMLPYDFNGRTKAGKELKAEVESNGKTAIVFEDILHASNQGRSVMAHPIARELFKQGEPELGFRIPMKNFSLQCRCDWFCDGASKAVEEATDGLIMEGDPYIADLKATADLDDWMKGGSYGPISKFGYNIQAAFYKSVVNKVLATAKHKPVKKFVFVVVESKPPYETAVIVLDAQTESLGAEKVAYYLKALEYSMMTGHWDGYDQRGIIKTGFSEWQVESELKEIRKDEDLTDEEILAKAGL